MIFPEIPIIDFGVTNWRWICNYPTENLQPTYMLGATDLFLAYPIGKNSVYCYAHIFDPEHDLFKQLDHHAAITKIFANYGTVAKEMLQRLPANSAIIPGRLRSVAKPCFSKGLVAMVGDAGNACSPMLQQGAACAFEDVFVLTELIKNFPMQVALAYYEQCRKDRVSWIVQASDTPIKKLVHGNSWLAQILRNWLIRSKGPFNVRGWRKLLNEDPFANLRNFIAAKKQIA